MHEQEGAELEELLRRAGERGVTVSLDLSLPDPASEAGKAPWRKILHRILPYVDIFLPSLEEIAFMMDGELYHRLLKGETSGAAWSTERPYTFADLSRLGGLLLDGGVAVAGIKCGVDGFYLATGSSKRIAAAGRGAPDPEVWSDRELFGESYELDRIASATGAGDASIAGFLAACLAGETPEIALSFACAAGGATTTVYDTESGITGYRELKEAFVTGGRKKTTFSPREPWIFDSKQQVWVRPRNGKEKSR
jgi:sugar/nucleoside kinase (ribokinase family)